MFIRSTIYAFTFVSIYAVFVFGQGDGEEFPCGEVATTPKGRSQGIYPSVLGSTPWQVALYALPGSRGKKWEFKCAGTIVTPTIVITAASCVFNENIKKLIRAERLMVIAAKQSLSSKFETDAQQGEVKSVHVQESYEGEVNSQRDNIAILSISPPFEVNDFVQPVCIDWDKKLAHDVVLSALRKKLMTGAAWGLSRKTPINSQLKEGVFRFQNLTECRAQADEDDMVESYLGEDKFCIVTPSGRVKFDTGMGLFVFIRDRYFLQGVLSESVGQEFSVVTNVTNHYTWLKSAVQKAKDKLDCKGLFICNNKACIQPIKVCNGLDDCGDNSDENELRCGQQASKPGAQSSDQCALPSQRSGVKYTLTNCTEDCDRQGGDKINKLNKVTMQCGRGTAPADEALSEFICLDGALFPKTPNCIKLCPKLVKETVTVKCEYSYEKVNCSNYMKPGTIAKFECQEFYTLRDPLRLKSDSKCGAGGKWSEALPECTPKCGVPNKAVAGATPTVSFGLAVKEAFEYPWHVAVYTKNATHSKWVQICGGSLINTHLVLTAAHCLHLNSEHLIRVRREDLLIAGGKLKRDFYDIEEHQLSSEVIDVLIPITYSGYSSNYLEDIAIVELLSPFVLSDYIRPVCIKFGEDGMVPTTVATVVGWGYTEKNLVNGGQLGESSPILLKAELPLISTIDCREKVKNMDDNNFFPFITKDKFCGLYVNGSGPQPGDSGGGVIVRDGPQWFIEGIVSMKEVSNTLAAFTNVRVYKKFILDALNTHKIHTAVAA